MREATSKECPICGSLLYEVSEQSGFNYEYGNQRGVETWNEYRLICDTCDFECDPDDDLDEYYEQAEEYTLINPDDLPF